MKKETLSEIVLGTIGGLIFAIGMCMCLLPEWNMFVPGVVIAIVGFAILLAIIPVYKKSHPKKQHEPVDWGIIRTWAIGVIGALVMGFGMSKTMVGDASTGNMVVGMIIGVVGLLVCALNYPIHAYLSKKD